MEAGMDQLRILKEELLKKENIPDIVRKFTLAKRGVKLNNSYKFYTWEELISDKVPLVILKTRIIELNTIIMSLEPGINSPVCFRHTVSDHVITFTWQECKELIIEAVKYRQNTESYKALQKKLAKAEKKLDFRAINELSKALAL